MLFFNGLILFQSTDLRASFQVNVYNMAAGSSNVKKTQKSIFTFF